MWDGRMAAKGEGSMLVGASLEAAYPNERISTSVFCTRPPHFHPPHFHPRRTVLDHDDHIHSRDGHHTDDVLWPRVQGDGTLAPRPDRRVRQLLLQRQPAARLKPPTHISSPPRGSNRPLTSADRREAQTAHSHQLITAGLKPPTHISWSPRGSNRPLTSAAIC